MRFTVVQLFNFVGARVLSPAPHPAASHHLPWFLTGPSETDILMVITTIMLIAVVFGLGTIFFRLHSLPERLGHKKLQFEIVAVLGLLSLFTHVHAFWVAGLLLALIDLPDFQTPLKRIAGGVEKLSGIESPADDDGPGQLTTPASPQPQSPHSRPGA